MRRPIVALLLLLVVACSTGATAGDAYVLSEWDVEGPGRLTEGETAIRVENTGEFGHTLVVTGEAGNVVAATSVVEPGATAILDANLEAGTYVFSCRIVAQTDEGGLSDHYQQGMNQRITVSA
jgi:hypothetical protein